MKMNKNQNGVTLVEVIVAMALLGVIGTMLCVAYGYSNHERVNNLKRVQEENKQATDIEQFDYKSPAVDYSTDNLELMSDDQYTMTFDFTEGATATITHQVYGFTSTSTDLSDSGFALKFFTPSLKRVTVDSGETWLTVRSTSSHVTDTIVFTASSAYSFFDGNDQDKPDVGNDEGDGTKTLTETIGGISSIAFGTNATSVTYSINGGEAETLDISGLAATKTTDEGGKFAIIYFNGTTVSTEPFETSDDDADEEEEGEDGADEGEDGGDAE